MEKAVRGETGFSSSDDGSVNKTSNPVAQQRDINNNSSNDKTAVKTDDIGNDRQTTTKSETADCSPPAPGDNVADDRYIGSSSSADQQTKQSAAAVLPTDAR